MNTARPPTLSVSELNRRARMLLETHLSQIWVEGEISNFSQPGSGHWYFSLKDSKAQIRCAMFKNRNLLVRIQPKAGLKVLVRGRLSLYEPRGDYQLIVESMEPAGEGLLQKRFEELKAKLAAEGLFDQALKKPLPQHVAHIAVISSISGAAVHDILHVLKRRNPNIQVTLVPSAVQGNEAPAQLIHAMDLAEGLSGVDAIIIGRGGGSLEDLWAFNDELLARRIFACNLPVVSAVGHEIDFSISDLIADYRAPTPSAAAEVLSGDTRALIAQVNKLQQRKQLAMARYLGQKQKEFDRQAKRLRHPGQKINQWQQRTDICEQRIITAMKNRLHRDSSSANNLQTRLHLAKPSKYIHAAKRDLVRVNSQLHGAIGRALEKHQQRLEKAASALDIVSPLSTLRRGYAIVRDEHGKIIKSTRDTDIDSKLTVQLHDGTLETNITKISPKPNPKG